MQQSGMAVFVLVHSPSVGPATWQPVARCLAEAGERVAVPSLLPVGDGPPPYWERVVAAVAGDLSGLDQAEPLVLVGHSNAGVFVPVLVSGLGRPVARCIFADATVPALRGSTPMAPADFLPFLRGLTGPDGRLPRWTDWWDEADTASMYPDADSRAAMTAQEPRLPLDYYLEQVPAPASWSDRRCGYLRFSAGYESEAELARQRGWPVRTVPGEHLHQLVDPMGVSQVIRELAEDAGLAGSG
jgi:hypothetical protein